MSDVAVKRSIPSAQNIDDKIVEVVWPIKTDYSSSGDFGSGKINKMSTPDRNISTYLVLRPVTFFYPNNFLLRAIDHLNGS